jgi:hypothetical protein
MHLNGAYIPSLRLWPFLTICSSSALYDVLNVVEARGKRDNKEYKGALGKLLTSSRRFICKFWKQESDKEEVEALLARVDRLVEQFKVRGLHIYLTCIKLNQSQINMDLYNARALGDLERETSERLRRLQEVQLEQVSNADDGT